LPLLRRPHIIIETFAAGCHPKHRPAPATTAVGIDTS
jgi:hypothetical protein